MTPQYNSISIQAISPILEQGKYPVKRRVGDEVKVSCEAFRHGHDGIKMAIQSRVKGLKKWTETPMLCTNSGLDTYEAFFKVEKMGFYEFRICGHTDHYENWAHDTIKKRDVGEDLESDLMAGIILLEHCSQRATQKSARQFSKYIKEVQSLLSQEDKTAKLLSDEVINLAAANADKEGTDSYCSEVYTVRVDRQKSEYASWYELFPRSAGHVEGQSGTFKDVQGLLPYIHEMGFDVLYFTPIHPIGHTKRKGRNNALIARDNDPGSPYAIGDESGGHFAIHPELGSLQDFDKLVTKAATFDIELALDFALNCSPDHPYLKEHPDWFYRRPDGSIKFAENPPKKYEDIYPLNFECDDRESLWNEIRDILLFWADHGVKTFRVDNPHTKPIQFWEWCIAEVHQKYNDVVFLSEAFTKPRVMESLAKVGYCQSYGYFTWRESKEELTEYFNYLNNTDVKEYMICNVFTTTPDILPKHLQFAPREMFMVRHALAATLSPVYGMYSGYELIENKPVGYKDELLNSEKYEHKVRDFSQENSIAPFITQINKIRRENPALQKVGNLTFHDIDNDSLLLYSKKEDNNLLLIVVNLDPHNEQSGITDFPFHEFGLSEHYSVHDLLSNEVYQWSGSQNYISLTPHQKVAHIFRVF
jgi:starch synthase (maltosyl-transferring)